MQKLSEIHLKLSEVSSQINKIFSPLMIFSFGITFCMLCVFVFTVLFIGEYWFNLTWFAITNGLLNIHLFLTMLGVLWACEATVGEGRKGIKLLFWAMNDSNDRDKNEKVKLSHTRSRLIKKRLRHVFVLSRFVGSSIKFQG